MGINGVGLNLQTYLRNGKSPDDLSTEFGIYHYEHPALPLVGFKYGLIESDEVKFNPIVRECRGIILERDTWKVVAYPFNRFFNLGEDRETESQFNWRDYTCQEKIDGSLIIVYYYADEWHVNTSGSFAKGVCYDSGTSWEDLFWQTSGIDRNKLIKTCTYIFELWTKYNKIVRSYERPSVTLIGMRESPYHFIGECSLELPWDFLDYEAENLGVNRPKIYTFKYVAKVIEALKMYEQTDPTFEGFVLCDDEFRRIKVKSDSYKQLHQLKGNGQFIYRNIIPQLLRNNFTDLAKNFPEWLEELENCKTELDHLILNGENVWWECKDITERKEFALKVLDISLLPAIMFYMRDGKYDSVKQAFLQNEDMVVKFFETKHAK